jgi:hypothetical protein
VLFARGLAEAADFRVDNSATYMGSKRWEWTVFIAATPAILSKVRCVEYELHPTFPNPLQVICDRGYDENRAFPLNASGWGAFNIRVKVTFSDRPPQTLNHWLKLVAQQNVPCPILTRRSLTEDDVLSLPPPWRDTHIYVEELHRRSPAELIVFVSARKPDRNFDWDRFRRGLKEIKTKQPLTPETWTKVSAAPEALQTIVTSTGPQLRFFAGETSKATADISICDAARAK